MDEKKPTIEERFAAQRKSYSDEIAKAIPLLRSIKNLVEAKVAFLSLRQRLLEDNHAVIEMYNKMARSYREQKSIKLIESSTNMQIRLNEREKEKYIDGTPEVSKLKTAMDVLDAQSRFLQESMKTVDQVLFGLKVRVDTEKILLGL